jgi:hypothetical protein
MKQYPFSTDEIYAIIFLIITAVYLPALLFMDFARLELPPPAPMEQSAWDACILWIERTPKIPGSEAQEYTPENMIQVREKYPRYKIDIYYPSRGDTYHCDIRNGFSGDWYPISISVTFG